MIDKQNAESNRRPLVSVGMPLYNEECYLSETLDSLLGQDFYDFEIVIRDNGSSDKTPKICEEYAKKDKRIRFYKERNNIGEIANFNKVFELARGKYFMWAAGHDLWDKTFLIKCVDVLEKDSSVVACFSFDKHIDESGKVISINELRLDTRGDNKLVRFVKSIWILHDTIIFGLMRTESLKKVRPEQYVQGPDHVVRAELSLLGSFAQIEEPLFSVRSHRREDSSRALQRRLCGWNEFVKLPRLHMYLPHLATVYEYARGACRLLPHWWQKAIYGTIAILAGSIRYGKVIIQDLAMLIPRLFKK